MSDEARDWVLVLIAMLALVAMEIMARENPSHTREVSRTLVAPEVCEGHGRIGRVDLSGRIYVVHCSDKSTRLVSR